MNLVHAKRTLEVLRRNMTIGDVLGENCRSRIARIEYQAAVKNVEIYEYLGGSKEAEMDDIMNFIYRHFPEEELV